MRVAVCGLGLIGGSIVKALADSPHEVIAYDPNPWTLRSADSYATTTPDLVGLFDSDLLVVAVPYPHLQTTLEDVAAGGYQGIVTDTGSIKGQPWQWARGRSRYVGSHPMAGKERSGWEAAEKGLFHGRTWVSCLEESTDLDDWTAVTRLALDLGSRVVPLSSAHHDAAVARISHVEHVVAAAVAHLAADPVSQTLAAGSYRDTTRVVASPAQLFDGMVQGNTERLRDEVDRLSGFLSHVSAGLTDDVAERAAVTEWFERAQDSQRRYAQADLETGTMHLHHADLLNLGKQGGWIQYIDKNMVATTKTPHISS
ncbi:prephenate dehydrogenase [Haloglycomyces albus]|uniref:prephenate dehydrogenase n=1 Tax=Haloglycomyces albus TaxID=526067 RepID=UPI00046D7AEC|nr:prephenate dehydrogenase/arogenate dehydrogenase family protein [Haloglycomyces albus]